MENLVIFVNIFVESPTMDAVVDAIRRIPGVVKVFEVTGEFDIVVLLEAHSVEAFRGILKDKIMKIPGVKSTVTDVVLKTHNPEIVAPKPAS